MRAEFIARRELMVDGLNAIPGVTCVMPHGAFYTFPNVSSFGRSSTEIADHLLYDAGVCGLAGTAFGEHGEGYLRFSYANSRENLNAALERVADSLAGSSAPASSSGAAGVTGDEPRVLVTRVIPDEGLEPVREACEVDLWEDELPPPRDELLRRVAGIDGLLSLLTDTVDDELLDAAGPPLKVVSNFAVGFDNIDVPASPAADPRRQHPGRPDRDDRRSRLRSAHGGRAADPRGGRLRPRRELAHVGTDAADGRRRPRRDPRHRRLRAHRARDRAPRARLRDADPVPRRPAGLPEEEAELGAPRVEMDELLRESDFVSLHVNLTDETQHLVDADALRR